MGERGAIWRLPASSWVWGLPAPAMSGSILSSEPGKVARASWAQGRGGAASVVEASQGHCLDPLTCLGPQHSSQSPQGEGRRTWSPPPQHWPWPMQTRPPTRQEDTVEPGLGRHSRRRAPQGPAGLSDVSSHWARPRCPLVHSALASQTTGQEHTERPPSPAVGSP